jgi:hypothetical protein
MNNFCFILFFGLCFPRQSYLLQNSPIRLVESSPDGSVIAIAGKHGAALFDCSTSQWILFNDSFHERQLVADALTFISNDVLMICATVQVPQDVSTDSSGTTSASKKQTWHEMILYPKHNLDVSGIIGRYRLRGRVAVASCFGKWLCIYLKPGLLVLYEIVLTKHASNTGGPAINRVILELAHSFSIEAAMPSGLKEMCLLNLSESHHIPKVVVRDRFNSCHLIRFYFSRFACIDLIFYCWPKF